MAEWWKRLARQKIAAALFSSCCPVLVSAVLSRFLPLASAIPLCLCVLTVLAWKLPRVGSVIACVTAMLSLDFFYTQPRYTLRLTSVQNAVVLASFLASVLFITWLSGRLATQAQELEKRENAQMSLRKLAERSIQLDWRESVADELCRTVRTLFHLQSVCIWDASEQRLATAGEAAQASEGLRAAFMAERDFDIRRSGISIRVLRSGVKPIGSLQLEGNLPTPATIGALVSLVSLTLERTHALENEIVARSESFSEQLRSSVLDGLAHSIKTPLTTVAVSAAGVDAIGGLTHVQTRLLHSIHEQTERMTSLADRLLRTARIDSRMVVKRRMVNLAELVETCILGSDDPSRFQIDKPHTGIVANVDPDLLKMAINQIAENALKYSSLGTPVTVVLTVAASDATISIHNSGSYIPAAEVPLVFKRFYRAHGTEHRAPGTGLGLFVAKHAVEALGGKISLSSDRGAGTTFTLEIPLPREMS